MAGRLRNIYRIRIIRGCVRPSPNDVDGVRHACEVDRGISSTKSEIPMVSLDFEDLAFGKSWAQKLDNTTLVCLWTLCLWFGVLVTPFLLHPFCPRPA